MSCRKRNATPRDVESFVVGPTARVPASPTATEYRAERLVDIEESELDERSERGRMGIFIVPTSPAASFVVAWKRSLTPFPPPKPPEMETKQKGQKRASLGGAQGHVTAPCPLSSTYDRRKEQKNGYPYSNYINPGDGWDDGERRPTHGELSKWEREEAADVRRGCCGMRGQVIIL